MVRLYEIVDNQEPQEEMNLDILRKLLSSVIAAGNLDSNAPFIINPTTLKVNNNGYVDVKAATKGKIPLPFGEVGGSFDCSALNLTTLENAPFSVGGSFECNSNHLKSLEYSPTNVGGNYFCGGNDLTSLKYAPDTIKGNFNCLDNQLTSLEYAPAHIDGNFNFSYNHLMSLKGLDHNNTIGGILIVTYSEKLPLLRLCLGKMVTIAGNNEVEQIFHSNIQVYDNLKERIYRCQYDLIRAGYKDNAKW